MYRHMLMHIYIYIYIYIYTYHIAQPPCLGFESVRIFFARGEKSPQKERQLPRNVDPKDLVLGFNKCSNYNNTYL